MLKKHLSQLIVLLCTVGIFILSCTLVFAKIDVSKETSLNTSAPSDYIDELGNSMADIPSDLSDYGDSSLIDSSVTSMITSDTQLSSSLMSSLLTSSEPRSSSSKNSSVSTSSSSSKASSSKATAVSSTVTSSKSTSSKASSSSPPKEPGSNEKLSVQVTINGKTAVKQYDAIDILSQVVAAEMGSSFHTEALKAQAVAAHTYIKYYNNLGKAPSVPISAADDKIINAVKSVRDKLVYYDSKPINAVYHACAAGKTNSAADVWGGAVSYLVSVESKYDHLYSGYQSTKQYSVANFKSIIKEKVGIDLEGSPSEWIKVLTRTSGGYVGNVSIGGEKTFVLNGKSKTITGRDLRENILSFGIKSAKFDYSANKSTVTFTTYGYGHGVGMSQVGANLYAQKEGLSYSKILTHYYKGTTVK